MPTLTIRTAVKPPTGLAATAVSTSQIGLSWLAPGGFIIVSYELERSPNGTTGFALVASPTGLSVIDTGLSANTTYWYRVRGLDNQGNLSTYSSVAFAATLPVSGSGVPLTWTAPTLDESGAAIGTIAGYLLYAGPTSDDFTIGPQDTASPATSYAWTNVAFTSGSTWWFWVRAYTASGAMSQLSTPVSKVV